jgi:Ubiquitin 3 binding protein But2 C-terminal domain
MHSTITLTVLSALSVLSFATPTPVRSAPRCGTTIQPSTIELVNSGNPTTAYGPSSTFSLSNSPTIRSLVQFTNIPAGAYGCSLITTFPAGYHVSGTAQADVYRLNSDITSQTTWDSAPSNGANIGPVTFANAVGGKSTINTVTCAQTLNFGFGIVDWAKPGSDVFFEQDDSLDAGLFLVYDC